MHPRMFLEGFWRTDIKYQVFVAMPFGPGFDEKYDKVIEPAIKTIEIEITNQNQTKEVYKLTPYRVDNSRSGDSILTEIMDGVAHSYLVLADLSEVGRWVDTSQNIKSTPNGNVMYEVGLAFAARQQSEVILTRDKNDKGKLLFDISTIPCVPIDYDNNEKAISTIQDLIMDRSKEIDWRKSNKVRMVMSSLSINEIKFIRVNKNKQYIAWKETGSVNFLLDNALPGLLEKGIIEFLSIDEVEQVPIYGWTLFGSVIKDMLPEHNEEKA